ncbi:unnamed protein product, partial [Musa banksii]
MVRASVGFKTPSISVIVNTSSNKNNQWLLRIPSTKHWSFSQKKEKKKRKEQNKTPVGTRTWGDSLVALCMDGSSESAVSSAVTVAVVEARPIAVHGAEQLHSAAPPPPAAPGVLPHPVQARTVVVTAIRPVVSAFMPTPSSPACTTPSSSSSFAATRAA